jgi:hypothetical protein
MLYKSMENKEISEVQIQEETPKKKVDLTKRTRRSKLKKKILQRSHMEKKLMRYLIMLVSL